MRLKGGEIYLNILLLVKKLQLPLHPGSQGKGNKRDRKHGNQA